MKYELPEYEYLFTGSTDFQENHFKECIPEEEKT